MKLYKTAPISPYCIADETSSYPGWIKSPHVITLGIPKLGGGVFRSKLWSSQIWSFPKLGGGLFRSKLWSSQIWSFPKWGGVFRSKLWSSQIWSFPKWGGYFGVNFGHPKSEVFRKGGYFGVNFGHPKSEVFRNGGGGYSGVNLWSGKFGPKFTVQPETCLCITVVSHILRMWRLKRLVPTHIIVLPYGVFRPLIKRAPRGQLYPLCPAAILMHMDFIMKFITPKGPILPFLPLRTFCSCTMQRLLAL